jgi:hypothetical protein
MKVACGGVGAGRRGSGRARAHHSLGRCSGACELALPPSSSLLASWRSCSVDRAAKERAAVVPTTAAAVGLGSKAGDCVAALAAAAAALAAWRLASELCTREPPAMTTDDCCSCFAPRDQPPRGAERGKGRGGAGSHLLPVVSFRALPAFELAISQAIFHFVISHLPFVVSQQAGMRA